MKSMFMEMFKMADLVILTAVMTIRIWEGSEEASKQLIQEHR